MYQVIVKRGYLIDHTRSFSTKKEAFSYGQRKEKETYACHSYYNEVNDIYKPTYENYIVDYQFPKQ